MTPPSPRRLALLIVAAAAAALAGAFFAQYVGGLEPCPLCLWQRYPYGAAIVLGLAAFAAAPRRRLALALIAFAGLAFVADAGVAFYHVGVEYGWFEGLAACGGGGETPETLAELEAILRDTPPPACNEVPWSLFGVSMAGYNLLYAAALAVATLWATARTARGRRP
ncbi:MAG: disulfide bond formation protein B [Alphaproteobacteria bacterium]